MKIKIKDYEYEIIEVEDDNFNLTTGKNDYHWGTCHYDKQNIYLMKSLNNINKRKTLIHELTHAFINSYGLLQVYFNDEIVGDFMSTYSEDILKIVNEYFGGPNYENTH